MTLGIGLIPGPTWHGRTVTGMRLMMILEKKNVPEPLINLLLKVLKKPWQQTGLGLRLKGRANRSEKIVGLVSLHQIFPLWDVSTAVEIIECEIALIEMLHQTRARAMASTCTTPWTSPTTTSPSSRGNPRVSLVARWPTCLRSSIQLLRWQGQGQEQLQGQVPEQESQPCQLLLPRGYGLSWTPDRQGAQRAKLRCSQGRTGKPWTFGHA